jgi:hypothetical protein
MAAIAGFTVIETMDAGVTVSTVDPLVPPKVAVIVAVPVARDVPSAFALTVAVAEFPEVHVAVAVRSWELPSVKLPVAVNCCVVPNAIDGPDGLTAMDTSAAVVTVKVVEDRIDPDAADTVQVPLAMLVANPCLSDALLMAAIELSDEVHWTEPVISCVLWSLKVPVAANCWVVPRGIDWIAGLMAIEINVAGVTVKMVEPPMLAAVAAIVVWPVDKPAASPFALTLAIDANVEVQVADAVRSSVLPSA